VTHGCDVREKGIQLFVCVEHAVVGEIVGRHDRAYALAPCLLVDRLNTAIRRHRRVVSSVRGHRHL
jgi:hypothetical protein